MTNEQLDMESAKRYESVVARRKFLAQDRPDIRKSVKERCREMSSLKKLGRHLKGTPRVVQKVKFGANMDSVVNVCVDSDWAGRARTWRSTNGGCIWLNGACLKTWSTTQTVVARSSNEEEYYAAITGAAERHFDRCGQTLACDDRGPHRQQRLQGNLQPPWLGETQTS